MRVIPNMINDTTTDDRKSLGSSYIYVIISASASLSSLFIIVGVLVIVTICIYKVRKRRRQTLCRNLERHYETVDEPIYENVPNETHQDSKTQVWSDFNTDFNEAYQSPQPIYETVPNETHQDSKTQVWSDFNTDFNEAYQSPHYNYIM